jgi:transcriptional regulator with XRE-family HTH domain
MHSRASQTLAKAFQTRGVQKRLASRTGISQPRLSRLARGGTAPTTENSQKLKDDPEVPIDPAWWSEPAASEREPDKGAA